MLHHMRTHTKEKPYLCDYCCRTFSMKFHSTGTYWPFMERTDMDARARRRLQGMGREN
ncbi:hypothetical protein DPMN_182956 [Dreissena polymorpha]|uniref:C2H2-type domain-containing protein n=1 Tax=Dreissena polymorpha TaxID=45954 RepID=A0A9D4I533_DREPO|nr:hypothetical protein DPMN_182956 [Dreissena polymorpha]